MRSRSIAHRRHVVLHFQRERDAPVLAPGGCEDANAPPRARPAGPPVRVRTTRAPASMRETSRRSSMSRHIRSADRLMMFACFLRSSSSRGRSRRRSAAAATTPRGLRRSWDTMDTTSSRIRHGPAQRLLLLADLRHVGEGEHRALQLRAVHQRARATNARSSGVPSRRQSTSTSGERTRCPFASPARMQRSVPGPRSALGRGVVEHVVHVPPRRALSR